MLTKRPIWMPKYMQVDADVFDAPDADVNAVTDAGTIAVTKAKEYVNIDAEAVVCSLDV